MEEEIYRGYSENLRDWVFGQVVKANNATYILEETFDDPMLVPVDPESIGKWLRIIDRFGSLVFEGDVVQEALVDQFSGCPVRRLEIVGINYKI